MDRHEYDMLLGRLAVHFKVLSKDQVGEALKRRRLVDETLPLGSFLVDEQYITAEVLQKLDRARAQYLEKQGLQAPGGDPGDQTQPVMAASATQDPAASTSELDSTSPQPSVPEPMVAQPAPPQPALVVEPILEPVLEPVLEPDPSSPDDPPLTLKPLAVSPSPEPLAPASPAPASTESTTRPPAEQTAASVSVGEGDFLLQFDDSTTLENLLQQAQQLNASDLHLHSKAPIRLRLNGSMQDAGPLIEPERARQLVFGLLTEDQRESIQEHLQLDFSFEIQNVGRFRSNAYKQQKGWDAVFRVIPAKPPSLEDLGLPADLERVVSFHQGMVLFTGPAGCGKSSTMAAMVNLLNHKRPDHILTVEDPIEYVHPSGESLINQREVGQHTESFARALRAALREDPDIIVIGELRDLETIELALTAAETGHLVLGTLHTSNAIRTINRLLGVFPPEQQNQIRTMVSESLRAVVSQRLVPRADGQGRVAAIEVLMNSKAVGNLIREKKTFQIQSQMQTGARQGMVLLDNSLAAMVKQGQITKEEARRNAEDQKRFS